MSLIKNRSLICIPDTFIPDFCIFHNVAKDFPCPDGIASAWVVREFYKEKNPDLDFIGWTYEQPISELVDTYSLWDKKVLIVDFSIPVGIIDTFLSSVTKEVYIIDHHKSFSDAINSAKTFTFDNLIFDVRECGATLTWKTLFKTEPPPWLQYIRDNDLFLGELPLSAEFHYGCARMGRTFELFDTINSLDLDEALAWLAPKGAKSIAKNKEKMDAILQNKKRTDYWYGVPVIRLTSSDIHLKSRIAAYALNLKPAPFCVILENNNPRIRVKTNLGNLPEGENLDLLKLFEHLSAAGHQPTCGFRWYNSNQELKVEIKQALIKLNGDSFANYMY